MAKALFGHVTTAPDRRLIDEVTKLRARVNTLEFENTRLRAENDRLAAAVAGSDEDEFFRLAEPVLA
jgi:regulator of replication initiation timing